MSEPGRPSLFSQLHNPDAIKAGELFDRQCRAEHERVKYLMQTLGLGGRVPALRREADHRFSRSELRFSLFNEIFDGFPFLLGCNILAGLKIERAGRVIELPPSYAVFRDPDSTEPARFKEFAKVPFVHAYRNFYESVASTKETRKIGLVFPRKGFLHGMIIHNDESEMYWSSGLCWVYKARTDKHDRRLYVQPFAAVVEAIRKSGWKP